MREYVVEHTIVNCKWTYDRMLPSLPGPGTPAFAKLTKELHPFGISPEGVLVDAPLTSLASVVLSIVLLKKRAVARITAESFELVVNNLLEADEPNLVKIAASIFAAIGEIDPESEKGQAVVRISSHLKIDPSELNEVLAEHLITRFPNLVPDTAIYVTKLDNSEAIEARLLLTKSLIFPDSIFVDMSVTYKLTSDPTQVAQFADSDFKKAVKLLSLKEKPSQGNQGE